jgi:tetratricopeptide (TPR) repeat protein
LLINCVESAANASQAIARRKEKPRFGLITYASTSLLPFSAYAFAVNQAYAEHNGYLFHMADPSTSNYEPKDLRWNKVKIVEKGLRTWANSSVEFIVWLDADLVVLDMGMKLELIVQQEPRAEIWLSTEHAGSSSLSNTGFIIFRNSEFTRWFLNAWWTFGDRTTQSDQESFDQLYRQFMQDQGAAKKIVILPTDALNSYPPAATRQKPSNQVLHLMGDHTPFRARAFRAALRDICRVVDSGRMQSQQINTQGDATGNAAPQQQGQGQGRLQRQLGVDQAHLLAWGLVEYKHDFERSVAAFEARLNTNGARHLHAGYNDPFAAGHLTNAVIRYSEMLEWVDKQWAPADVQALRNGYRTSWESALHNFFETEAEAAAAAGAVDGDDGSRLGAHASSGRDLRRRLFYLLVENLEASSGGSGGQTLQAAASPDERVVLLKDVLEQGQNLMKVVPAPAVDEKRQIMDILLRVSEELLAKVEPGRRNYVRNAIGELQIDQAFLALSEGGNESSTGADGGGGGGGAVPNPDAHKQRALVHLQEALRIKEDLALEQGDHALPQVLIVVADFFCRQLRRYQQSWPYFDRAVTIYERRMGSLDPLLGTYLYLSAQARMAAGDDSSAVPLLRRAIGIMEANGRVSRDLSQAEAFLERALDKSSQRASSSESTPGDKVKKKKRKRKFKSRKESTSSEL